MQLHIIGLRKTRHNFRRPFHLSSFFFIDSWISQLFEALIFLQWKGRGVDFREATR